MAHETHDYFVQLTDAMDAADMAWWQMELPSGAVFFGENKTKMLGYDKKNFFHYSAFTKLIHPEDYDKSMKAMQDHIDGKKDYYEITYRIMASDGSYKTFYDRGKIVQKSDNKIVIAGIVMSVTGSSVNF